MWKHVGDRFVYEHRAPSVRGFSTTNTINTISNVQQPTAQNTATSAPNGTFVDADGQPANGDVVAGVATNGRVVSSGVVQAYVIDNNNTISNLTCVYSKSINGIASGKVVLQYDEASRAFVMAETKSNAMQNLKDRLDALTGG